ncbi:MAG: ligase-associated DNA damage response endonuclease PdeM [Caulobacteraceae bacterium]
MNAAAETRATPSQGLRLEVAGVVVHCRPSGALWLESERALVAADLHFEKGSAYAARGQLLPPYDTGETLSRLEGEIAALRPRLVVLLGDSFHDRDAASRLAAKDAARIAALAAGRRLVWILGNHDRAGPVGLPGEAASTMALGGLALVHEPLAGRSAGELAGHLHPCVKVRGPAASVRRRCFATDGERMVLPAFGAYAGGLNVLDPAFRPVFPRRPLAAALGVGQVHLVGPRSMRGD